MIDLRRIYFLRLTQCNVYLKIVQYGLFDSIRREEKKKPQGHYHSHVSNSGFTFEDFINKKNRSMFVFMFDIVLTTTGEFTHITLIGVQYIHILGLNGLRNA